MWSQDLSVQFAGGVGIIRGKFEQHLGVRHAGLELLLLLERFLDSAPLLDEFLGGLLVVPEPGFRYLRFELG